MPRDLGVGSGVWRVEGDIKALCDPFQTGERRGDESTCALC